MKWVAEDLRKFILKFIVTPKYGPLSLKLNMTCLLGWIPAVTLSKLTKETL